MAILLLKFNQPHTLSSQLEQSTTKQDGTVVLSSPFGAGETCEATEVTVGHKLGGTVRFLFLALIFVLTLGLHRLPPKIMCGFDSLPRSVSTSFAFAPSPKKSRSQSSKPKSSDRLQAASQVGP